MGPRSRTPHVALAVFLAVAFLAQTWPVYAWTGARIEPRILGLPFSFAWVVAWVAATFGALVLYHAATRGERRARESGGTEAAGRREPSGPSERERGR